MIEKYSELYDELVKDLKEIFDEIQLEMKVNKNSHYNKSMNIKGNKLTKNGCETKHLLCYNVENLSDKDFEDLSPYSPLITINNEKVIGMLDTGAKISLINKTYNCMSFLKQSLLTRLRLPMWYYSPYVCK
jgi:hypothetical protein